ncbi:MAG: hypothetical protein A2776_00935 [Candidatus Levybacteria bacterium RIFCSPHIGHO2_01_FULL_40_10]|nr:MAG: hypothetical protein A2776_00935 [Candidatus Levybacteria bacterium RIFCSPHIGHO2_01_FULL_40_10]
MISILIISKNSEDFISDAIESVKPIAEEIIVVDDSNDNTPKIAEKLGAKVVKNTFKNFADQRNFAASLAKNDWIFYLDSDEQVTPEFIKELKDKIKNIKEDNDTAGFYVRRKTFFYGKDWGLTDRVQRVFRKDKLKEWRGVVHETPEVDGSLATISAPILHHTHRRLDQMVSKTNEWSEFEADLRFKAGHPKMSVWRFPRVMSTAFLGSYFKEGGWKNGTAGVVEAVYQMFSMFITYAKLWEKQQKK